MWIEREITAALHDCVRSFPALVLLGPRQVGKTSLLERAFPGHAYVTLDVPANAGMAESLPDEFLARHPPPVLIDEVQYAPGLFRHVKAYLETHRGERGLFLFTGSQSFALMQGVTESLAGRAAVVSFLGLSGAEWRAAMGPAPSWADFLWRGGFPALWSAPDAPPDRDRYYQSYLVTYLERDVRNLLRVGNLRDFDRFLRACAVRTGQLLNVSDLARDVGIAHATAREWLSVLVASNQVILLEPYYRSLGKRLVKSPKLYVTDTGLAAFLMGFQSPEALWSSAQAGALWETYVVGQWLRWREWHRPAASLWFWQDRSGNEVDLVIELDQKLVAIECKRTAAPEPRDLRGIQKLRDLYGPDQVAAAYVACTTPAPFVVADGVEARSGWTVWPLPSAPAVPLP